MSTPVTPGPPILTHFEADKLLHALRSGAETVTISLDLGLTDVHVPVVSGPGSPGHARKQDLCLEQSGFVIGGALLSLRALKKIASEERKCFEIVDGEALPISTFSETTGWVRTLCPTAEAPTTIVAGFPMHRTRDVTPVTDTRYKVSALGRPQGKVLDTATGLGYTAIELAKTAAEVVTVEIDPAAIALARKNPWSRALFTARNVRSIIGDINAVLDTFADAEFSAVLHDPPSMQLAGDLYSGALYRKLRRVLRRGGRLFHYTGDPESDAGARVTRGVIERLRDAGFDRVQRHPQAFGVTAV